MTSKLVLPCLPCQAPGVLRSALGLAGPVSVYCDCVRWKVRSATSISVWQHVNLPEPIRPRDSLARCWHVKQTALTTKHHRAGRGLRKSIARFPALVKDVLPSYQGISSLLPRIATSPACYSPVSLLPRLVTPPYRYFPGSLLPRIATSPARYSPVSLLPRLVTPPYRYFPGSLLPRIVTSPARYSPVCLLSIV